MRRSRASRIARALAGATRGAGRPAPRQADLDALLDDPTRLVVDLHTMKVARGASDAGVAEVLDILARAVTTAERRRGLLEDLTHGTAVFVQETRGASTRVLAVVRREDVDPRLQHESFEHFDDIGLAYGLDRRRWNRHSLLSRAHGQPSVAIRNRPHPIAATVREMQARVRVPSGPLRAGITDPHILAMLEEAAGA